MQKILNKILVIAMLTIIVFTLVFLKIIIDKNKTEIANKKQLYEAYTSLEENKILPENTKEMSAGTEVKLPQEWYNTETEGETIEKQVKVASVVAVATGNGETVPVPEGFYYVGGTKESGVVISSDERDKNKYAGVENVPAGAVYNSDGTVKTYTDEEYKNLTDDEKKAVILGDQFVWIPVTVEEYKKSNTWNGQMQTNTNLANAIWDTQTNTAELPQIQKYGGFYMGRYEAGTSELTISNGTTAIDFAAQNTATSWANASFSVKDGSGNTATGKITTKAGEIPYYHADYFTAHKLSQSMYTTNYVQSGLVTGTMWDAMLKFIGKGNESILTSSTWGNYKDTSIYVKYTAGQGRYATVDSSNGTMTSAFKVSDGTYYYGMKTTAISEDVKQKNLYDVAGNLWEWTKESVYVDTIERDMLRGGSFVDGYSNRSVCWRSNSFLSNTRMSYGFRPVLYLK